jgi:hypothetical protein
MSVIHFRFACLAVLSGAFASVVASHPTRGPQPGPRHIVPIEAQQGPPTQFALAREY